MIVLGARTEYSFLRGYGTPEQWRERGGVVRATVLGLADDYGTWGHRPFAATFRGTGIQLLYGARVPVVTFLDRDPSHSLVTLYAKKSTDELYSALTMANQQTYYRPRLTWRQVAELKDCVVIVNDVLSSHVKAIPAGAYAGYRLSLPDHFPKNLPWVLAYGPSYPSPEDHVGYEVFEAISTNHRMGELENDAFHLLRESEARSVFPKCPPEAQANMSRIAQQCCAIPPQARLLSMGIVGNKKNELYKMACEGMEALGILSKPNRAEYLDRLDNELKVIADKDFCDYFFFVADIVAWAKQRMFVGPGRGSAGGSLLCYLLGITTVDPLAHNTMFERFIDVTRSDLPDIDIDFPDTRREEVFDYIKEKYGADKFARLGTLSLFGGKSALNAVARATGVPFEAAREVGKWTEGAGQGVVISPKWIFENVEEIKPVLARHPGLLLASHIDGHVSHHGVHASGVVVTDDPICRYGSVDREGVLSLDMGSAEAIGLVKLDALGLRTLSVIQETCDLAGIEPATLYTLNWNDKEILDGIFNSDRVTGVFQFEGHATRSLLRQVRVDRFGDLCALTSLSRPGPLLGGAAHGWIKAKQGESIGELLHECLAETYGTIVYQEQMMTIARDIAGFDVAAVNGMRRAVGKKDVEKLKGYRDKFINGCEVKFLPDDPARVDGQIARARAEELWEEICEFGSYSYNKAHAVAYTMVSVMCAHLKLKHPLEFQVAQLRNAADDDQIKALLREFIEGGGKYIEFDPALSGSSWTVVGGALVGGFDSIRGIGSRTAEKLVEARAADPSCWLEKLTDTQRQRIEKAELRWGSISYFGDKYADLYSKPESWRSEGIPKGIKPPIHRVRDIPDLRGGYAFVGRITKKDLVDDNSPERVEKRGGSKRPDGQHLFLNLTCEDDSGEIRGTVSRFTLQQMEWLKDEDVGGRDFLFRAEVIESGRRWLFFSKIIELKPGEPSVQTNQA